MMEEEDSREVSWSPFKLIISHKKIIILLEITTIVSCKKLHNSVQRVIICWYNLFVFFLSFLYVSSEYISFCFFSVNSIFFSRVITGSHFVFFLSERDGFLKILKHVTSYNFQIFFSVMNLTGFKKIHFWEISKKLNYERFQTFDVILSTSPNAKRFI